MPAGNQTGTFLFFVDTKKACRLPNGLSFMARGLYEVGSASHSIAGLGKKMDAGYQIDPGSPFTCHVISFKMLNPYRWTIMIIRVVVPSGHLHRADPNSRPKGPFRSIHAQRRDPFVRAGHRWSELLSFRRF